MEMYSSLIIVAFATIATAYPQSTSENKKPTIGGCKFPPDPPHGRYVLVDPLIVEPGQKYDGMTLRLICDPGYGIFSSLRPLRRDRVGCHLGYWPWSFSLFTPVCERFCELPKDEDVEYRCIVNPPPSFCWRFYANGNIGKESCPIPDGLDKGYRKPTIGGCKLPSDPPHGRYVLVDPPFVEPGQEFDSMTLRQVCDKGYGIFSSLLPIRRDRVVCYNGFWPWSHSLPSPVCERFCELPKDEDVEYRCIVPPPPSVCYKYTGGGSIAKTPCPIPEGFDKGYRICEEYEQNGTVVQPVCKKGKYTVELSNSTEEVPRVTCESGTWNRRFLDPCTPGSTTDEGWLHTFLVNFMTIG